MNASIVCKLVAALWAAGLLQPWVPDEHWLRAPHPANRPKEGFVAQKRTAISIGRAAIDERYGEEFRKAQEPFNAKRFKDVWVVYGYKPIYILGGTVNVVVSVKTGAILKVFVEQ